MIDCAILTSGCFFYFNIMTENEIWKDVPGYEGYYQASNLGRVRSLDRVITDKSGAGKLLKGRVLSPTMRKGYKLVTLTVKGRRRTFNISQLVAMAFLGHKPDGLKLVVDHIDGNKLDDRVENLRIVTNRANASTCFRANNGTFSSKYVGVCWDINSLKWISSIHYDGIRIYLGSFDHETDASDAYQKALSKIENSSFNPNDYKPKYSSKYTNVTFRKDSMKWRSRINVGGKIKNLGSFKTEKEAYEAQQKALKEYNL